MSEKSTEQKLVKAVKSRGGIAPKFFSPGFDGVPDRIVLLPRGRIAFVELKAKGRKMRPLQVRRKRQLGNTILITIRPTRLTSFSVTPFPLYFLIWA